MGCASVAENSAADEAGIDLGIDTASARVSVAALRGERVLAERGWTIESTLSRELLAGIDALLREAGVERHAIASIAVTAGPGAYTGLRTGVATAQGLALGLDAPLAGVSRLEADAFAHLFPRSGAAHPAAGRAVVAVHDLGRGRVAWAAYAAVDGAPLTLEEPRIDDFEECARLAPRDALWCGELSDELRAARDATERPGDRGAAPGEQQRRAADVVRLARMHATYGDPAAVDVVYLRPPSITAPVRRGR